MIQTAYAFIDIGRVRENNEDTFHLLIQQALFIVSGLMGRHINELAEYTVGSGTFTAEIDYYE